MKHGEKEAMNPSHPMQPLIRDKATHDDPRRTIRFKENKLVHYLVNNFKGGLNKLSQLPCDPEDYEQLMQLIGYSVCGYTELSMISEESKDLADAAELAFKQQEKKKR